MRIAWSTLIVAFALCACARPAPEAAPAPATPAPTRAATTPATPVLSHVVLDDPGSDSPFRWLAVDTAPARPRLIDGALWAPALPVASVLSPEAAVIGADPDGTLRVDGAVVAVPVRMIDGVAWADVQGLAAALGGYARRHPDDGSIALWPEPMLRWLAQNGDPRAPVLLEARAAGVAVAGAPAPTTPAATNSRLRIRNEGPAAAKALRVQFPKGTYAIGDVAPGATSDYVDVPEGVYGYGAYRLQVDGRDVSVPVIDFVGESPLAPGDYTYVVAVDPAAQLPVALVRVQRDR